MKKLYAKIEKVDEQGDGTIMVYGYASSGEEDSQGEVVSPDAMKAALPDYMKFANIREMHQPSAVGKAKEAEVQEDGRTWIGAHVVDPIAVKKVQTGVYSGFSIGGKVTKRDEKNAAVITGLRLSEISLVDRPANPEAVVTVWKMDEPNPEAAVDELAALLDKGEITPAELVAMAKAHIDAAKAPSNEETKPEVAPEPEAKKAEPEPEVKKGMYGLSRFGDILAGIASLCADTQWEADYEKDGSPLPAQLRDWIAAGIAIYRTMAEEETNELIASLQAQGSGGSAVTMSEKGGDVQKAGARFSKATKAALASVHKMIRECDKGMGALGYEKDDDGDDTSMSDKPEDVQKGDPEPKPSEDVTKLSEQVTSLGDQLRKAMDRIAQLEKQPAAPKGALRVVDKSDDIAGLNNESTPSIEPVRKADGSIDEVATLVKASQMGQHQARQQRMP